MTLTRPLNRDLVRSLIARRSLADQLLSLLSPDAAQLLIHPVDERFLFQDRAGTVPVTADGQSVGLMLDVGSGTDLGPELVTNGDFSGGSTGWTIAAPATNTITISGGAVRFVTNGSADTALLSQPWSGATAVGKTYRITFDVLAGSTGTLKITTLGVNTTTGEQTFTATQGFKSFTLISSNVSTVGISRVVGQSADATIDNISIREVPGCHLRAVSNPARGVFRRSGRYRWIEFNGVNTGYATAALPAPGVDKVQVFAAVRKASDAALGMLVETSSGSASNNGAFQLSAPRSSSLRAGFGSRGSVFVETSVSGGVFVAPASSVLAGIADISGDIATLRIDESQVAQTTTDQGTGNFNASGTYPLFIGARNGSIAFFNGRVYGALITRFSAANLSTDTITAVEALLANEITGAP